MTSHPSTVAVIGGGPAGLMAAEILSAAGLAVTVFERMPTVGRKLLMAGRGGLNLTHSEPFERFVSRYGDAAPVLRPALESFPPDTLRAWADGLGQPTFVGSSGRVFPKAFKASPLLRAWLARLHDQGVEIRTRHDWLGWGEDGGLLFRHGGERVDAASPDHVVLALGGASWPGLGSDGAWSNILQAAGVGLQPFRPANCGFLIEWTSLFRERFAGTPLKNVVWRSADQIVRGEAVITAAGIEGGAIYALSRVMRDTIYEQGAALLHADLRPDLTHEQLVERLRRPRRGQSASTYLRKTINLSPLFTSLLREVHGKALPDDPEGLARYVKDAPLRLTGVQPIARSISTAGGVALESIDEGYALKAMPSVLVAGEMIDWEAPTGGYLLQAAFATGAAAARAIIESRRARTPGY